MKQIHSILIVLCAILNLAGSLKLKQTNIVYRITYSGCASSMNDCKGLQTQYNHKPPIYYCIKTTFKNRGKSVVQYCITKVR